MNTADMRSFARWVYHRLPLSQRAKWRLRERLQPLLTAVLSEKLTAASVGQAVVASCRGTPTVAAVRDDAREQALARMLARMAEHAREYGPLRHWIALPFLATGGAERVALNLCRGVRGHRPDESVLLLLTDRRLLDPRMPVPPELLVLSLDDYLADDLSYARKQALLRDLLIAVRPASFHNINSEVAWHLILEEGQRLQSFTRLFASIFAFQFTPDGRRKIGYAAGFLKKGMPHLCGLLSDNQRFLDDAAKEYHFGPQEQAKMHVLYQPCRLLDKGVSAHGRQRLAHRRSSGGAFHGRPQVLWAGRLDAEKRVDLFLDVVRQCPFADFRVFGQVVLDQGMDLPVLPNLSYEGPFSSPIEWLERFDFDAFLFTSRWEGMPNILLEVGALAIPVIAPTVGGVAELITEETGYPLPQAPSVEDYCRALQRLAQDPGQALARAERLLEKVETQHQWSSFAAELPRIPGYLSPAAVAETASARRATAAASSPTLSVIVPCFNQGRYLHEAISSVLAATTQSVEIIVVDDGSTDAATHRQLVEAEGMAPDVVRVHRQANKGLSGARNSGLALARGRFVQFLDADDVLAPGKIDAQVAQMDVNPLLDVSVCNFLLCDESRSDFTKPEEAIARFALDEQDFLYRWERGFSVPIHCGLFRSEVLQDVRFDTSARAKEDWLFWTALAMKGTRFAYLHGHWAMYRQHEGSMRRSQVNMGRAWLQAGLKIDAMLAGREPLFFESVVAWFEQCYRSSTGYHAEIAAIHSRMRMDDSAASEEEVLDGQGVPSDVAQKAQGILQRLSGLGQEARLPLISVVLPVYNHYDYLAGCLESLGEQGDAAFEIVCVDDGSPDKRVQELLLLLKDKLPQLKIIIQPKNSGISSVQNLAAQAARGEFLAFLDCDDGLAPRALQKVLDCLQAYPEVDYVFTDRFDVDENDKVVRLARYGGYDALHFKGREHIRWDLLDGMVASHLKVIRRSIYLELGGSAEQYAGVQDWELALKIAENHRLHYLELPLYRHRVHSRSVTRSDMVAQFRKTNILRRIYAKRWLAPEGGGGESRRQVFGVNDFPIDLSILKQHWQRGDICIADVRADMTIAQCNFLREFNSYFDQILWASPEVPCALYSYVWDAQILQPAQPAVPEALETGCQ